MKKTFLLRMKADLKEWYEKQASDRGVTMTALIIEILRTYQEKVIDKQNHIDSKEDRL